MFKISLVAILGLFFVSCGSGKGGNKGINLFTLQQDRDLGAQVAAEIDGNRTEYPLLDSASNKLVYEYIYNVRNKILNSGNVVNKDNFSWRIRVIKNDTVQNAFCTPGGYIYIYTGILRFLDSEDQFAGVLAHEIAHADLRHSTRQISKMYTVQAILKVLAGDRQLLTQLTSGIVGLKFSRSHETEADENSVKYLCPTDYNAAGGAGFFEKIQALGGTRQPQFMSTHPNPDNRIEHFNNTKTTMGCSGTQLYKTEYQKMVSLLPR